MTTFDWDQHSFDQEDPVEDLGARMVREVASKTSDIAGDGTTTATVLAQAIIREGSKNVAAGANPMGLKRGIERAVERRVTELKGFSQPVKGDMIAQVGITPRTATRRSARSSAKSLNPSGPRRAVGRVTTTRAGEAENARGDSSVGRHAELLLPRRVDCGWAEFSDRSRFNSRKTAGFRSPP
jgi:hypothetical protein